MNLQLKLKGIKLRASFVGHSTVLIQTQGLNFLTDPVWSNRASPFKNIGPERYAYPGIPIEKLPPIDFILLSHNHYDHMDINTLVQIWDKHRPRIFAPLGNDLVIQALSPEIKVETLDWHESVNISKGVNVHLAPSQHWSKRGFFDQNKALWGAFIVSTPSGNLYFCGDSGYGSGKIFREVRERFGSFRFAMLPLGAYEPRWFMKYFHMNPEEAVFAHKDLGQPYTMAMHYETFRLTDEGFKDPSRQLSEALVEHNVSIERFRALQIGEAWMIPEEFLG
ncbi:MAG TPA: MBL fold metallo-hydrolase [Parachlamydiaceae bacterium]|nr:MBL fold metallo-hydrolase [Parachlamydiaceae bacterium]